MHAPRLRLLLGALALAACAEQRAESPSTPPNVLIVSLDSTRRDLLSCYGHVPAHAPGVATSPHLDRLAAEGVRFANAYATTSWTLPSHMALMTGRPDLVHGVEYDGLALDPQRPLLAEVLRAAGYRTAGFFTGPYLSPAHGFGRGFDTYRACYSPELSQALATQAEREHALAAEPDPARQAELVPTLVEAGARVEELSHRDVTSRTVTDAALAELARLRADARPWFLFVHYFDPHYDYVPPSPHDTRFDPRYGGTLDGRDFFSSPAISVPDPQPQRPRNRRRTVSRRDLQHVVALYEGELSWTDEQVGRLLDDLSAHGELDRTIVVALSDHGDEFFEHGNIGHRRTLLEEVVRVPLIVRYPPALPPATVVHGIASVADVFPTVVELAGLDADGEAAGASLLALVREPDDTTLGRAMGRLVDPRAEPTPDGIGQRVRIRETYLRWPIKVRRMRQWIDPTPNIAPAARPALQAQADRDRARDLLLGWIDLERHPDEPLDAYSTDFDDPRARVALQEFRAAYRELSAERRDPHHAAEPGAGEAALRGLGYGGDDATDAQDLQLDRFLLTPPGE